MARRFGKTSPQGSLTGSCKDAIVCVPVTEKEKLNATLENWGLPVISHRRPEKAAEARIHVEVFMAQCGDSR